MSFKLLERSKSQIRRCLSFKIAPNRVFVAILKFRTYISVLLGLKALCKALHKLFYAKQIVMQSRTKKASVNQSIPSFTLQYHFA